MSVQSILQELTCWHELQDASVTVLKAPWEGTVTPVHFLTFLAALFQVPKHELFRSKVQDLDELLQPLENEEDQQAEADLPHMNQSAQ